LASEHPGYAVVDLKLNGVSGLVCVQTLHAFDPDLTIVVLTGFASIATAVEAIKLGARHYLAEPASTDDIEAAFCRDEGSADVALGVRPTSIKTLEWENSPNSPRPNSTFLRRRAASACIDVPWRGS
jgi:two-component system response regulator RegA